MDFTQIWKVITTFVNALVDSWFVFFSLLGVAIFVSHFFVTDEFWKDVLFSTGSLIVVSGGFSAMTRWLSVHGLVKNALENILYNGDSLKDKDKFDELWNKLVSVSLEEYMPSLEPHIHKEFLRDYLPSENEIYYKEYHQSFDVYWKDKAQRIIKIIEKTDITLYTGNEREHGLPYFMTADHPDSIDLCYKINTLKIDTNDKLDHVEYDSDTKDGVTTKKVSYKLKISGKKEYRYFRNMERHIRLDYEPFIVLGSGWHTYKPKVTVNCHDQDIKAYFTSTGTIKDFVTVDGENNSHYMKEEYPELMMKAQGYSIYFASKQYAIIKKLLSYNQIEVRYDN